MPATPLLARPTSVTGLVLSQGTVAGGGQTATTDFYIKVIAARFKHRTKTGEVTGDGDRSPNIQANYYLYVNWLLRGYMVANVLAGVANLINTDNNPTNDTVEGTMVKFLLSSQNTVTGRFVVEAIDFEWLRTSQYIGVSMFLRNTNNDDGTLNYAEATS